MRNIFASGWLNQILQILSMLWLRNKRNFILVLINWNTKTDIYFTSNSDISHINWSLRLGNLTLLTWNLDKVNLFSNFSGVLQIKGTKIYGTWDEWHDKFNGASSHVLILWVFRFFLLRPRLIQRRRLLSLRSSWKDDKLQIRYWVLNWITSEAKNWFMQ